MGAEDQKTILLVEDEVIIAMAEKLALEKYGYKVITANRGEEAVATVENTPAIDLILMDINLGAGIDGTEAAEIILRNRDIPVVFLSSHTEPEIVAKTEKITSYGYAVKNSGDTVLQASIKMAFKLFEAKTKEREKESQMEAALEALRDAETRYRLLFEQSPDGIVIIDPATAQLLEFNETAHRQLGYSRQEFARLRISDFEAVETPEEIQSHIARVMYEGLTVFETRHRTRQGEIRDIHVTAQFTQMLGRPIYHSIWRDITERKQAEDIARAERQRFYDVLEMLPAYITLLTPDYHVFFSNRFFRERFGESKGRRCFEFLFERNEPCEICETYMTLKTLMPREWEWTGPDSRNYHIFDFPFTDTDSSILILEMGIDVTELKRDEEALRESEKNLREAQRLAQIGSWNWTVATDAVKWSEELYHINGRDPNSSAPGYAEMSSCYTPESWERLSAAVAKALQSGEPYELDLEIVRPDGSTRHTSARGEADYDASGKIAGLHGTVQDISERKQAEEKLRVASLYSRSLIEASLDALVTISKDGKITDVNTATESVTGVPRERLIGSDFSEYFTEPEKARKGYEQVFEKEFVKDYPLAIRHVSGSITEVLYHASVYKNADGHVIGVLAAARDITKRKRAEEALRKSEAELKEAQRIGRFGNWDWNAETDTITWSEEYYRIYGFDSKLPPPGYEEHLKVYAPESAARLDAAVKHSMQTGEGYKLDLEAVCADGTRKWVTAHGEVKRDASDRIVGLRGTAQDISERKQAEAEITRQLAEKAILLKEVHHRIKNNIASIGGLISLHMQSVTNPEAIAVLKDASSRVNSMRILYDKLLFSEDYKDISVKNYLDDLIDTIIPIFPGQAKITVKKSIADFQLDPKRLFPLGSIINELLTNIIKYAFIDRDAGLIKISLTNVDQHVKLVIQDNGSGLPAGFDINEAKGLGLTLVKMLSQQLGGSFTMEKHKGTRCKVEFNI